MPRIPVTFHALRNLRHVPESVYSVPTPWLPPPLRSTWSLLNALRRMPKDLEIRVVDPGSDVRAKWARAEVLWRVGDAAEFRRMFRDRFSQGWTTFPQHLMAYQTNFGVVLCRCTEFRFWFSAKYLRFPNGEIPTE